jgi:hypothetical protein
VRKNKGARLALVQGLVLHQRQDITVVILKLDLSLLFVFIVAFCKFLLRSQYVLDCLHVLQSNFDQEILNGEVRLALRSEVQKHIF